MIQISRKEQQVLRNLQNVMAAEQTEAITGEMLQNVDPGAGTVDSLVDKGIILYNQEEDKYTLTKDQLQVQDDDPEVEAAWEEFRQVSETKSLFDTTKAQNSRRAKANQKLKETLTRKGRLIHLINKDGDRIWCTEGKVEFWKKKGYREGSPEAMPLETA